MVARGAHVIEHFEQVTEIVEATMGHLWGERLKQGTLFDIDMTGATTMDAAQSPTPRAALFDLDGVVVSTMTATREALAAIASRHTGQQVDPPTLSATDSPPAVLRSLGVANAYDVYRREYSDEWTRHLADSILLRPVVESIEQLRRDGWRVGAITSQNAQRDHQMIPSDVRELFEIFHTTARNKTTAIRAALVEFGVEPARAFYIGDQVKDVEAAREAGVLSVAASWGYSPQNALIESRPDVVLSSVDEAVRLVNLLPA